MPRVAIPYLPDYQLRLHAPVASVWTPDLFDHPDAPPSQLAMEVGQRLASAILHTQGVYVYDIRAKLTLFVSAGVERMLGYPSTDFTTDFHYALIHPDDLPIVTEASILANKYVTERLDDPLSGLVFSVDYRMRHRRGHWVRVLRQNIIVARDTNGAVVGLAGILTDITAHKSTNDVRFHMNRPDFAAFVRRQQVESLPEPLSTREQEIMGLLLEGLTSKEIGEKLFISPTTVQKHRQNIRLKVGSHNVHQLLQHLDAATGS
ncbi:hypothetical protein E5K00_00955 [Hymenobacter aquaticus]|uniref:PAS domain-containing protein n=1 Tax=Hymenobacter aquaticus TaxID=1867101 RepID=A0A4Z0Q2V3_9BACT|nr:LuxR C-terminal-related transcriptional regulator [Hymenobacter aquaticus]TGE23816.1 hypothetical protein E5K00_00955 [Hymenobacter aquaticus]